MWSKLWCAPGLLPLILASCATSSAVEQDLSLLRRQVAALERSVRELDTSLRRIDDQVTLLGAGKRAHAGFDDASRSESLGQHEAPPPRHRDRVHAPDETVSSVSQNERAMSSATRPTARQLPVVHFRPQGVTVVPPDDDTALPPESLDSGQPPILIKLGPSTDDERIPVDRDVLRKPDPVLDAGAAGQGARTQSASARADGPADAAADGKLDPADVSIKAEYERALGLLRDEDRPKSALTAFLSLGERATRSKLADNVAYWTGECQFALGAYSEAIRQFERTVRDYPRSPKVPYALLGVAEGWLKLDKTKKARRILRRVIQTYPGSDAASRARARLSSLG
ncbi:MAG: tetratricopeptide repeat protein [Deltaproteobacteria bacterium]|nr:tetratricopeptide repeat protein [Deltaproteobacteria bacterium]